MTFVVDGDAVYSAVDDKPKSSRELKRLDNIARDPRVSVLVEHYDDDWSSLYWCRVDGSAHILRPGERFDGALSALAEKYAQYRADRPTGPVIAVDAARWSGWSASVG